MRRIEVVHGAGFSARASGECKSSVRYGLAGTPGSTRETHSWGFQEDADAEACVNWKLWDRCGPSQAINTNPVRNVPSCPKKPDDVHEESEDETIFSCVGNLVGKIA